MEPSFQKIAGLDFISVLLLHIDSTTEVFLYVLCKVGLFENSEQDIFAILFLTKLQAFNL